MNKEGFNPYNPWEEAEKPERPPREGTKGFKEAKEKAGVVSWLEVVERRVKYAEETGDQLLLENSVKKMITDADSKISKCLNEGELDSAGNVLENVKSLAKKYNLEVGETLESYDKRVLEKNIEKVNKMKANEICQEVNPLLIEGEPPFSEDEAELIRGIALRALEVEICRKWRDALLYGAVKRYNARPHRRTSVFGVGIDENGVVFKVGKVDEVLRAQRHLSKERDREG